MPLKSKLSFTKAEARNTSFSCTGVLRSKLSFLKALFIHPNKKKVLETTFEKGNGGLAASNLLPNTY
jgi:hypothetical protein